MDTKNENVLNVPNEKNFALSKVKIVKDGGLDVHFEVTETIGNESYTNKYHVESAKDIHPDLRGCFKELRPIMGRILNLTSFLSMVETDDFKANKKQTPRILRQPSMRFLRLRQEHLLLLIMNWINSIPISSTALIQKM